MPTTLPLPVPAGRGQLSSPGPGIVRVRLNASEEFLPERSWSPVLEQNWRELEVDGERVRSGDLKVELGPQLGFRYRDTSFATDLGPFTWEGPGRSTLRLGKALHAAECVYGLGQRTMGLDRRGNRLSNWTVDPEAGQARGMDNLYQAHPFLMAHRPGFTWGLLLNCTWHSVFDVGKSCWDELWIEARGGELDYYLMAGPDPAGVLEKLAGLIGKPALMPLWALGNHQSRWGYVTQAEIGDLVAEFRKRDLPLDAVHLDIDHMSDYRCFTFDPERFPEPARLTAGLRDQGVSTVTIVDPGIKFEPGSHYPTTRELQERGYHLSHPDGTPFVGYCWPDAALYPDFSRPEARRWWGEQFRGFVELGVEGFWLDMNEPANFDRPFSAPGRKQQAPLPEDLPCGPEGERTVHAEVHNLYGLQMSEAARQALLDLRPGVRPWLLTRSAFCGVARHSAVWMGDNSSWFEHLQLSLPQLLSMGLCGVPHCGVDVGGFFENCDPELYARWIEVGAFYPFLRTHSASGTRRQEPWSFGPAVEEVARKALDLRYRLLPYLYTLNHRAHHTGEPLMRPLVYDFPRDPETFHLDDQFMLGPQLMVAPALQRGQTHRLVYLPEDLWYDFWSGAPVARGHQVAATPPGRPPLYVRGGSLLTLGNPRRSTRQPLSTLTLAVYPGRAPSRWTWIEDDGCSLAGPTCSTTARFETGTLVLEARQGEYDPGPRQLEVRLRGVGAARKLEDRGQAAKLLLGP